MKEKNLRLTKGRSVKLEDLSVIYAGISEGDTPGTWKKKGDSCSCTVALNVKSNGQQYLTYHHIVITFDGVRNKYEVDNSTRDWITLWTKNGEPQVLKLKGVSHLSLDVEADPPDARDYNFG